MDYTDLNTEAHDAVRDLQDARSAIQRNDWRKAEVALAEALARIRRLQREIQGKLDPLGRALGLSRQGRHVRLHGTRRVKPAFTR
jgi:CRP-like cAMP-binding protein